jgi:hypothetical protein
MRGLGGLERESSVLRQSRYRLLLGPHIAVVHKPDVGLLENHSKKGIMPQVHWQPPPICGGKSRFLSSILGPNSPFQDGINQLYADFAATVTRITETLFPTSPPHAAVVGS